MHVLADGRVSARAVIIAVLIILAALFLAAPAFAAPDEPTLTVAELRTKLDTAPLDGYMKTVVSGYTIEQIPLTVESIVDYSWGSLILFEAYGPIIDKIGSCGPGMSGSPIYVTDPDDGGAVKLVGALSYGYDLTVGGMCMATPIEYMSALEDDFPVRPPAPGTYPLEQPVATEEGTIASVRVVSSAKAATVADAAPGEVVMAPLGLIEIGGLDPRSAAYKDLAAELAKQTGLTVHAAGGTGIWTGLPAPDLTAGSAFVEMFSRGAVWYGGAGTVTYVHDGIVMGMGHSSWWTGATDAAMTGGYVAATWNTLAGSLKEIIPRDVKGTITQDRTWGVGGVVGQTPDMVPVTSHVTFPEQSREVSDASEVAEWTFQTPIYGDLAGYAPAQVLWDACDAWAIPGSAETTTTLEVSDATGAYTVTMHNFWSDAYDITYAPVDDLFGALYTLSDDPDGNVHARLESVDFDATVSSQVRTGRLVDLALPQGLRVGDNEVIVSYYRYGSTTLQTVTGTLTIPEGTPTNGTFDVMSPLYSMWMGEYGMDYEGASAPKTLAELVQELNSQPQNSDLILTFWPREEDGSEGPGFEPPSGVQQGEGTDPYAPIEVVIPTETSPGDTGYVLDGELYQETWYVSLEAGRRVVPYDDSLRLFGIVQGAGSGAEVDIYTQAAGDADEVYLKTVMTEAEDGTGFFTTRVGHLTKNTRIIARVEGANGWLTGDASVDVGVSAAVRLTARSGATSARLTAHVLPKDTGGLVAFQVYRNGRWQYVGTPKTVVDGIARIRVAIRGTVAVRARFLGSDVNMPAKSATIRVSPS